MKWPVIGLLCMGVVAALCAAFLMAFLGGPSKSGDAAQADAHPPEVTLVVAARNLPAMTVITSEMISQQSVPKKEAGEGFFTSPLQIVGKALALPMASGQPFAGKCFAAEGSGAHLAAFLAPGMRAVTISVNDYAGLEGLLYPGGVVDVLASFTADGNDSTSDVLLSGVQVLAIEGKLVTAEEEKIKEAVARSTPQASGRKHKVTLLVDTRQSQLLQLAMERGVLSLALRNPLDTGRGGTEALLLTRGRMKPFDTGEPVTPVAASQPVPPSPPPPAVELPLAAAKPPAQWDVTILRGAAVEVKSFPMPSKP